MGVVLITGAASGIGAAVCRRIAGPETKLVLHTRRNADNLEAVAAGARDAGAEVAILLEGVAVGPAVGLAVGAALGLALGAGVGTARHAL